jgi:adenylate cyclase
MRLDPFPRLISTSNIMALANYMLKRYGEAVRLAREYTSRLPNLQAPHLLLGSAYAQLGQLEEARKETAEVLRINPGFTIERFVPLARYKNPKDLKHRLDGLRKAGLPEA